VTKFHEITVMFQNYLGKPSVFLIGVIGLICPLKTFDNVYFKMCCIKVT